MDAKHRPSVTPSGHRKSVAEEPVTSVLKPGEVPIYDRELNPDEEVLAALGYKPEFKREFSLWTTFCVSFAVLGLLPSFASTLYYGMGYSGTPGMVWGWIIAMIFIQCVAAGMGELSSFLVDASSWTLCCASVTGSHPSSWLTRALSGCPVPNFVNVRISTKVHAAYWKIASDVKRLAFSEVFVVSTTSMSEQWSEPD